MKKVSIYIFKAVLLLTLLFGVLYFPYVADAEDASPQNEQVSLSSIIIKLKSGVTPEQRAEIIARNGGIEVSGIPALRMYVIELPSTDVEEALIRYKADPLIESAEPNLKRKVEAIPSDLYYTTEQWALTKIGWESVFGLYTPQGTSKVAVLDTGVDASHPDLQGRVLDGMSVFDDSKGLTDSHGHGTWLSGIIAANTDNSEGIAGVAFSGVNIIPVKVIGPDGTGQDSDIIQGIIWAAENGADVILMGFSNPEKSTLLQDAIDYAWSKGAVLVASTGNDGQNIATFPAGHRGVIGVSATDSEDNLAPFSNYGDATFLSAPGVEIAVTALGNDYLVISGTSPSAAIVAGVAAFIKAVDPTLTNGIIVNRLARTADPAGTIEQTGNGRVNMARALKDTSMDEIQPAGVDAGGGPIVGPYRVAAPKVGSVTVGTQSPNPVIAGNSATYTITVNRGTGSGSSGNFTATLSITTALPTGASASFSPNPVELDSKDNSKTATLTITTTTATPGGSTNFTVKAETSATDFATSNAATLTVNYPVPTLTSISPTSSTRLQTLNITLTGSNFISGVTTVSFGPGITVNSTTVNSPTQITANITITLSASLGPRNVSVTNPPPGGGTATLLNAFTVLNTAPVANNQNVTTNEDTPVNITLTASDLDNDPLTYHIVDGPTKGTLSGTAPNLTYTPNPNYNGSDSFTFKVNDGTVDSNIATVSITINPVNDPPAANAQSVTTDEDTSVNITLTASDVDGDLLSYIIVSGPSYGTLSGTAPNLTYTPNPNYQGSDSFTFKVNDGLVDSNTATVSITINSVNDPPVAEDNTYNVNEDETLTVNTPGVLGNDNDVDGDTLTAVLVSGPTNAKSFAFNPDGSFSYTPKDNFKGEDTFTYKAYDGKAYSEVATVTITVIAINDAPVATNDFYNVNEDETLNISAPGVLNNDNDFDLDTLEAELVTGPTNAESFTLNSDGSFTYSPKANFNGTDTFTYKAYDGTTYSNEATVTITVTAVNDAPIANNDSYTVDEDNTLSVSAEDGLLKNDTDIDSTNLTVELVQGPQYGELSLYPDGSFTYTPDENFYGNDSFTYRAYDGSAYSNVAMVTITVNPVNDPPVLSDVPESAEINELSEYTFTAQATDVDYPPQTLTFSLIDAPSGASIGASSGVFTWTPTETQGPGTYTFKVRVSDDGNLPSYDEKTITITVNEVNSAPTLTDPGDKTVDEHDTLSFTLSASDPDYPANTLTYSISSGAQTGMNLDSSTGAFSWTPSEAQGPGSYQVTFRVTDNGTPALYNEKTITITVNEVNVAPTLKKVPSEVTIDEMVAYSFDADAEDPDIPAQTLTFSLINAPEGASIDPSTGVFTWTPSEAQGPGTYTFKVRVSDGVANTDQEIKIIVREVNRKPDLTNPGNKSTNWGNTLSFTLSATDPDIPANTLTYSISNGAQTGMNLDSSTGEFSWTPTSSQIGTYNVTFKVTDNGSPNLYDEETITITVNKRPTTLTYNGASSTQYSDPAALSATLTDNGTPISGATITFTIGSQSVSAITNSSGVASTSLIINQAPGSYNVVSTFAGNDIYLLSSDNNPFTITKEDARVYYIGTTYASTACTTCSSATVALAATIQDITAVSGDLAYDPNAGDIRNATVTFVNRDNGLTLCTASVGLINPTDTKVGTATCNWTADIANNDSLQFTIGIVVNGYYTRNHGDDNTTVTVSKPLNDFITGGGFIIASSSAGQYAATPGTKVNFGFNVKYNKSGKNLQGAANIIVRSNGRVYQIKSNAIDSLSVNKTILPATAQFNSKANLTDITDPLSPIPLGGNLTLILTMTDRGEPGSNDSIGITLLNPSGGLLFSSNWHTASPPRTVEQNLGGSPGGGNLQVR